jgi:hypothetical protein
MTGAPHQSAVAARLRPDGSAAARRPGACSRHRLRLRRQARLTRGRLRSCQSCPRCRRSVRGSQALCGSHAGISGLAETHSKTRCGAAKVPTRQLERRSRADLRDTKPSFKVTSRSIASHPATKYASITTGYTSLPALPPQPSAFSSSFRDLRSRLHSRLGAEFTGPLRRRTEIHCPLARGSFVWRGTSTYL